MNLYTTSQISGLTRLPIKTIQRYIKNFPDAFSEMARKPRKGRRYTTQDADNLLTIRRMSQNHAKEYQIDLALKGALESPALPMVETENLLHIAEGARQAMIEAENSARRANESDLSIAVKLKYYDDHYFENRRMQRILEARMKRFEERLMRILEYFDSEGVIDGNRMLNKLDAEERAQAELQARDAQKTGEGSTQRTTLPATPTLWEMFKEVIKGD